MIKKNKLKILCTIFMIVILIHIFTFFIDYKKISNNTNPIFSIPLTYFKDGGTTVYYGFGYQVIYWHYLTELNENGNKILGYYTGYEIHHLFKLKYIPFYNKNIKPDKNTKLGFKKK
jgi:hypothetical protein